MKEKLFLGVLITLVLTAANLTVGLNDYLMLALALFIAYMTQSVIIELQMGSRAFMADHFNSSSQIKTILKTPGLLTKILSFIAAFIVSISFLAFVKGVMIKHGFLAMIIISFLITVFLYKLLAPVEKSTYQEKNKEQDDEAVLEDRQNIMDRHLNTYTAFYANFAFKIFIIALIVNLVFALIFTGYDTAFFIVTDVTLSNFDEHAIANAIPYREYNTYSRALINAYLLMDAFKVALVNQLLDVFFGESNKLEYFYVFYFLAFMLNVIKLIPLSVGYVLLVKGMRIRTKTYQKYAERILLAAKKKLDKLREKSIVKSEQNKSEYAEKNDVTKEQK